MTDKNTNKQDVLDFEELPKENCIIKVIGVGGGGGNAVSHMYRTNIHDVSFILCNTDRQALNNSPVPTHLQLGEGLGAGNIPEVARKAAEASEDEIRRMLNDGTKMSFITAGMGGGTGTGAAPIIARVSKELGILTVGIVTIPFRFEGPNKIDQALDGVEEMAKFVDALLVINNERLRDIYNDLSVINAFAKADDTLNVAVRSITEIITEHGIINLDFNDVRTVLKDGGVAIMSTGYGDGEGRVKKAIQDALHSPLLSNNDVFNSKKILLNISFAEDKENEGLMMDEMNDVHEFMGTGRQSRNGQESEGDHPCHGLRHRACRRHEHASGQRFTTRFCPHGRGGRATFAKNKAHGGLLWEVNNHSLQTPPKYLLVQARRPRQRGHYSGRGE